MEEIEWFLEEGPLEALEPRALSLDAGKDRLKRCEHGTPAPTALLSL